MVDPSVLPCKRSPRAHPYNLLQKLDLDKLNPLFSVGNTWFCNCFQPLGGRKGHFPRSPFPRRNRRGSGALGSARGTQWGVTQAQWSKGTGRPHYALPRTPQQARETGFIFHCHEVWLSGECALTAGTSCGAGGPGNAARSASGQRRSSIGSARNPARFRVWARAGWSHS
jgi:hypothetical protein